MKAINLIGQELIIKSMVIRINNKLQIIDLLRAAISIMSKDIELAKECVIEAYDLIQESLSYTFMGGPIKNRRFIDDRPTVVNDKMRIGD